MNKLFTSIGTMKVGEALKMCMREKETFEAYAEDIETEVLTRSLDCIIRALFFLNEINKKYIVTLSKGDYGHQFRHKIKVKNGNNTPFCCYVGCEVGNFFISKELDRKIDDDTDVAIIGVEEFRRLSKAVPLMA